MGADRKKFELPQATDTATDTVESTNGGASALDSQIQSDYTLPEGKDVVIPTRRKHRDKDGHAGLNSNKSQTSLLIEYFEGGKGREADGRRPSVRVKVTPSSKSRSRSSNDHIQITERNSKSRKALYTQRIPLSDRLRSPEPEGDGDSLNSYRSATEESNVTSRGGGPIEVEMMPKRHGSPLIPTESSRYVHANPSEISSMPADSFLDGSNSPARKGGRSLSRGEALAAGALTGAAAAAVADKLKTPSRRRSRSLSRERIVAQKAVEKVRGDKSERRRKHSSRSRSVSGEHAGSITSPRRRSSRGYHVEESMVSGGDPSLLSSHVSGRSGDAHSFLSGTSKSSINNPKLLETVEDAIRRLILPELTLLKREQSKHQQRDRERDRRGSITSGSGISRDSREESSSTRRLSDRGSGTDSSSKPKVILNDSEVLSENAAKGRKDKNIDRVKLEDSPRGFERETSEETVVQPGKVRKKHSSDRHHGLEAAAAGAGIGALAAGLLHKHQSQDSLDAERKERRRRRTKSRSRSDSLVESYEEREHETVPPMPLMSDINASEITRSSILSADTERPHSASQERVTPIREVPRGVASPSSRTPTRTPVALQRGLGTQHSNFSRDNLSLQSPTEEEHLHGHEYELDEHGRKVPMHEEYDQEDSLVEEEHHAGHGGTIAAGLAGAAAGAGLAAMHHRHDHDDHDDPELLEEDQAIHHDAYYHQEVPPPLRYVPYAQERRGLSPIQSVSGYTEGDPDQQQRDSRLTQSTGSYSSLNNRSIHRDRSGRSMKSLDSIGNVHGNRHDFPEVRTGGLADSEVTQDGEYWEEQHRENDRQRDLDQESYRSSDPRADYKHMTNYTDDSMDGSNLDRVAAGQNVRGLGANPNFVHTPIAVESAVASLVNASELTGESGYSGNPSQRDRRESYASYEDGSEKHFTSRGNSPTKHDGTRDVEYGSEQDIHSERNSPSKYADEYELDEHGRKVAMPQYKNSHATEAAIAAGAAGAAAALIAGRNRKSAADQIQYPGRQEDTGAPLHKSFADRAQENRGSIPSPRHSIDAPYSETGSQQFTMGASGLPDPDHPMPEIGFGGVESDVETNPSVIQGPIAGVQEGSKDHWPGKPTPPQPEFGASTSREQRSDPNLKAAKAALVGGAVGLGGAEALANHSRENSHDHDEEWQRTSGERKRDTLITNPYEGTSPIAAIGALDRDLLGQQGLENDFVPTKLTFQTARPLASPKDEGYISSAPNARSPGAMTPEQRAKGVGFMDQDLGAIDAMNDGDPFYTPKHARHLSGMSHGMGSPIYDSATGNGIDRIQSKDIVALMDHLTVRDAQRSARDTEILVTLVRAAAEMRNSFEDMKRLLADTEDVIITEVQGNTEKSVQKAINGPRPQPQSASRSLRQGSQDEMYDDLRNKKRNVFRRALKGLSMKSTNDLGKIEEMLVQLLGDVEGLKVAQGLKPNSHHDGSYDDLGQEGNYEGDRGYEPEGNAGTSTASHASQSGHLSIPRGTSASRPFETRKFSDHRISTVPEGDEEEAAEHHEPAVLATQFDMDDQMDDRLLTPARGTPTRGLTPNRGFTPTRDIPRGGSAPLGTPPQQYMPPASLSNENTPNTPKTDKKKKHASSSSSGWIPKVSRWSETTASTVLRGFRSSGRSSGRKGEDQFAEPPSRSGSDLGQYADQGHDPYGDDKLHSGFSQDQLQQYNENEPPLPPEDPKYKAHRNSLNLQHPQPRPGPTHRYQTALESQAVNFDQPMSPKFSDWGSQTSLNRLPPQQTNRYSNGTSNPGNMSPISDGGYSNGSAAGQPPARPPKEPLGAPDRPPKIRAGKLIKPSPLSNEHVGMDDYEPGGSPRSAARKLSGALAIPTRKPTGPRSMSSSKSGDLDRDETVIRRKNRDTFGTIASNQSGESETF